MTQQSGPVGQRSDAAIPECPVNVMRLPKLGHTVRLSLDDADMDEQKRSGLVEFMDVVSLGKLDARLVFRNWVKDGIQVEGAIDAELATECPISLKPVSQDLQVEFNARFVPPTSKLANPHYNEDGEMVFEIDGDDLPDIFESENLDAWAIAIEHLMLEIDYFARDKNAEFEPDDDGDIDALPEESPFAKLKALKK